MSLYATPEHGSDESEAEITEALILLASAPPVEDWMDHAECAGGPVDMWFPEQGGFTRPAKEVCRECPVRSDCLRHALAVGERFGVWGGLSEKQRRRIRSRRRYGR